MRFASREEVEWQMRAACRGPHASVFFPPPYVEKRDAKRRRELRAKEICASCPVQPECLQYALDIGEQHGIWGGLNEIERRDLLLRMART
ncbi:MAG: WhiB family transcriptional regulator [Acidimicrobiaceae bacterium]|nr:WhiB family transcriptional regulator [Acidimicrobiaceae bacterium]